VFRHSTRAHDSHFHLAIYFVHPASIIPRPPFSLANGASSRVARDEVWEDRMSPVDLLAIKKLDRLVNVLPVSPLPPLLAP
jgi:hypothetical protein